MGMGAHENKSYSPYSLFESRICQEYDFIITNKKLQHKNIHGHTCEEHSKNQISTISLIIVRKTSKTIIQECTECASNHRFVLG